MKHVCPDKTVSVSRQLARNSKKTDYKGKRNKRRVALSADDPLAQAKPSVKLLAGSRMPLLMKQEFWGSLDYTETIFPAGCFHESFPQALS
jgi:hypothetical protein